MSSDLVDLARITVPVTVVARAPCPATGSATITYDPAISDTGWTGWPASRADPARWSASLTS